MQLKVLNRKKELYLKQTFQQLQKSKPNFDGETRDGQREVNQRKNRDMAIVPSMLDKTSDNIRL